MSPTAVDEAFEVWWPKLKKRLDAVPSVPTASDKPTTGWRTVPLPNRDEVPQVPRWKCIAKLLDACQSSYVVRMIGVAARKAFLPETESVEPLNSYPVPRAVQRGVKINAIVCDPESPEAVFRSEIESGKDTPLNDRLLQRDARRVADHLVPITYAN